MRLIVGLGNPGRRYRDTWHNLGARTVEELTRRRGVAFRPGRGEFFIAEHSTQSGAVSLMIPTSYMNRSGGPVAGWMNYYRIDPIDLLVIFDDHDLPLGRIRLRPSGSSGGHRGMEDIIRLLGTDQFSRLRIGIQAEGEHPELTDQVLSKIPPSHRETVDKVIAAAADAVETLLEKGLQAAMNIYNSMLIE